MDKGKVLAADGSIVNAEISLFYLTDGRVLWSKEYTDKGELYEFNIAKTMAIQIPGPGQVQVVRIDRALVGSPARLMIPKTAIAMMTDIADPKLANALAEEVSGLKLVRG